MAEDTNAQVDVNSQGTEDTADTKENGAEGNVSAETNSAATEENTEEGTFLTGTESEGKDGNGEKSEGKAEKAGDAEKDKVKPVVPDKYEPKMPEGYVLDQAALDEVTPMLKELNVTQEQAQKLSDFYIKQIEKQRSTVIQAQKATFDSWRSEVQSDPEIGGGKLKENLSYAAKAIDHYMEGKDANSFRELLNNTGLGNYPPLVRMFIKIGRSVSEDHFVGDANSSGMKVDPDTAAAKSIFKESLKEIK